MTKRKLSEEDLALWRRIAANVEPLKHVARLAPKKPPAPDVAPAKPKPVRAKPAPPPAKPAPAPPPPTIVVSAAPATPGIDRRTTSKLRRGQIAIEATLDLHGMTQSEAHEALNRFIAESRERGRRCVVVVTGVGTYRQGAAGGVLRRSVPRWLAEPTLRDAVMSFAPAEPRHGGQGALYVLLRKRR